MAARSGISISAMRSCSSPGGVATLRRHLLDAATEVDWAHARGGFGDDELATE